MTHHGYVGPVDATKIPRYGGPTTFARLPSLAEVERADIAIVGVPFDSGVTYRPGARFGPAHVRMSSKLIRNYHPVLEVSPFATQQVADAGDIAVNPFDIATAITDIDQGMRQVLDRCGRAVTIGGDHTIALPILRVLQEVHGPVAVLHFDAHLDTWDTFFGAEYTHATPFRRASEEGLIDQTASMHVGIRGPIFSKEDLTSDEALGFQVVGAHLMDDLGAAGVAEKIARRMGDRPIYVSVDIDVLDPSAAPGTGTPEPGGLTSRELLGILRSLRGSNVVGADIVEVAPAYDHAEITGIAAAHVAYDLISVMSPAGDD